MGEGSIFHFQLLASPSPSSKNGPPAALPNLPGGIDLERHAECQTPMDYYHIMRSSKAMDQRDQFPMSSCLSMQQTLKLVFGSGHRRIEIPSNSQVENELDPVITWIES